MQTFFKKLCYHLHRQGMVMNGFDKLVNDGFVFIGIRIVFAHKLIQFIGVFDNIKVKNMSAVDFASCCENHLTAVIDKRTEKAVICSIEVINYDKRITAQTFQKADMLSKANLFIIGKVIPCKIHIGYHFFQTAVIIEIQNIAVFFLEFLCVCFGKFAFSDACEAFYENLAVFLQSRMKFVKFRITSAEISARCGDFCTKYTILKRLFQRWAALLYPQE